MRTYMCLCAYVFVLIEARMGSQGLVPVSQGAKLRASGRALRPLSHRATSPFLMRCILRDGKQRKVETHFWKGNQRNLIRSTHVVAYMGLSGEHTGVNDRLDGPGRN